MRDAWRDPGFSSRNICAGVASRVAYQDVSQKPSSFAHAFNRRSALSSTAGHTSTVLGETSRMRSLFPAREQYAKLIQGVVDGSVDWNVGRVGPSVLRSLDQAAYCP